MEAAVAKARQQVQNMQAELEAKANAAAEGLAGDIENQKAAMRACADGKLYHASALIVERSVNG